MKFNTKLFRGLPKKDTGLIMLILFTLKENINLYSFFEHLQNVNYKDVMRITSHLLKTDVLRMTYPEGKEARIEVMHDLYVTEEQANEDYEKIRTLWLSKNSGVSGRQATSKVAIQLIDEFLTNNTDCDIDMLYQACNLYINKKRKSGSGMLTTFVNFFNEDSKENVFLWIDEAKEGSKIEGTFNELMQ